jgi:hypothetical protein
LKYLNRGNIINVADISLCHKYKVYHRSELIRSASFAIILPRSVKDFWRVPSLRFRMATDQCVYVFYFEELLGRLGRMNRGFVGIPRDSVLMDLSSSLVFFQMYALKCLIFSCYSKVTDLNQRVNDWKGIKRDAFGSLSFEFLSSDSLYKLV